MYIKIKVDSLRFGAYLGYKLSRLEWIWGSSYEEVQSVFESSKNDILNQLPLEDIYVNESDFQSFLQSILGYYMRTDIAIYSSILIGITIQRCALIGASKNSERNEELYMLAKSSLVSIPQKLIPDKDELFEHIYKRKEENLFEVLDYLERMSDINEASYEKDERKEKTKIKPTLFLSYCEKDVSIANILESQLKYETNDYIDFSRYTRVPYKSSFKDFMNSIQNHDFVLCLVSDNYLKSQACMYEVGEVIKDHHFKDRLLFVVITENDCKYYNENESNFAAANIYGNERNRLSYIQYWKKQYEDLKEAIEEINDSVAVINSSKELKEIEKIYKNDIGEFLAYLSEHNGKCFEQLYSERFNDIIRWILPDWDSSKFRKSKDMLELLTNAIEEIWEVTKTDYNQIALGSKIASHQTGLVVYADNISEGKQRYRLVIMDGLMGNSFSMGETINVGNINNQSKYFCAVGETMSELVVPINFQGKVIGVINSESEKENYYSEEMVKKLCSISNDLSLALKRLGYVLYMDASEIPYVHIEFSRT